MKLIIQNNRISGTANDEYDGPDSFIDAPDDFDINRIGDYTVIGAALSATVPQSVTMRQAVLALLDADMLDDIEAIVAALPRRYQLEWERAANVYRDNALVETVRQQKSMTNEQIDDLFIAAFAL